MRAGSAGTLLVERTRQDRNLASDGMQLGLRTVFYLCGWHCGYVTRIWRCRTDRYVGLIEKLMTEAGTKLG